MPSLIPYRAVLSRILRLRQSIHGFPLGLTWLSIRDLQFKPCNSSNCSADLKTVVLGGPFQGFISKKPVSLLVGHHIEIMEGETRWFDQRTRTSGSRISDVELISEATNETLLNGGTSFAAHGEHA
jgi:hypothetical protein